MRRGDGREFQEGGHICAPTSWFMLKVWQKITKIQALSVNQKKKKRRKRRRKEVESKNEKGKKMMEGWTMEGGRSRKGDGKEEEQEQEQKDLIYINKWINRMIYSPTWEYFAHENWWKLNYATIWVSNLGNLLIVQCCGSSKGRKLTVNVYEWIHM